ncbi:MAG: putative spermidine/putrescine transport system ATP-binding protein [Chloroflexota bacterium]|nr:putative spermidine/putrescine transport system ATP-binding protein [Chloroflexota bacterium]
MALEGIRKSFGEVVAVAGVDLEIGRGEFFSLLGPSGSGKTTTLRMIAGFDLPTEGRILLGGEDVTQRPPYERDVNTVFQDYALFPHMDVATNVAYGLMIRKVPKAEREARVHEALRTVRLEGFERRKPGQLSGGQRQRVALARALINRPSVLLLDEPLGALDLKLRQEMQLELKTIQRGVGITFIYVTHDQEEALGMSDRMAIFNHGRIEQVGTPAEVYERPATAFVAGFVGTSNLLAAEVALAAVGQSGTFTVRPEKIRMVPIDAETEPGFVSVPGRVREVVYLGSETRYHVTLDSGGELAVLAQNVTTSSMDVLAFKDRPVRLTWDPQHTLPVDSGDAGPGQQKEEERA